MLYVYFGDAIAQTVEEVSCQTISRGDTLVASWLQRKLESPAVSRLDLGHRFSWPVHAAAHIGTQVAGYAFALNCLFLFISMLFLSIRWARSLLPLLSLQFHAIEC